MNNRDKYWDTLKFLLIFFVVYAHTIAGFHPNGSLNNAIYSFIRVFHMPLFIFISGRFSHIRDLDIYKLGILRIFETYIVFQFIRWSMSRLLSGSISFDLILSFLLNPQYTLWYLICLIYWRLIVMLIPQSLLLKKPIIVLALCFSISIFGGFVPVNILSLQRAMTFLPFFFMGYYSTEIDLKKWLSKIPIGIPVISVLISFLFIYFYMNFNIGFVLNGKTTYWSYSSLSPFVLCIARCVFILAAIFVSFMVMCLVRVQPLMAKMGKATLAIYIFHSFITQGISFFIKQGYLPLPDKEVSLFVVAVAITIGLAYLSRFKIVKIILNPITYAKNGYQI